MGGLNSSYDVDFRYPVGRYILERFPAVEGSLSIVISNIIVSLLLELIII